MPASVPQRIQPYEPTRLMQAALMRPSESSREPDVLFPKPDDRWEGQLIPSDPAIGAVGS